MEKQILQMKVTPPGVGDNIIKRQRLIKEMTRGLETDEGFNHKLTLISAPAGFGKTSLLASYYHQTERAACWLNLAEEDNSPNSLLLYLISAFRQVKKEFAQGLGRSLQEAAGFNDNNSEELGREVLNRLLNELLELKQPLYLLLDELQKINSEEADELLIYLVDNLPSRVHIIAASREMPSWPIARWRVEGKVRTFGQRELKFTPAETKEFLQQRGVGSFTSGI